MHCQFKRAHQARIANEYARFTNFMSPYIWILSYSASMSLHSSKICKTKTMAVVVLMFLACTLPTVAFPPAPFKTIFGTVRDEFGRQIRVDGATVVLSRNGQEVLRQIIAPSTSPDFNYQIRLRMAMDRPGTRNYTELIQRPGEAYTLSVRINDVIYQPIEIQREGEIGQPGERLRINLTLGQDSDGDGIPDAWKISQLFAAGILPDENGWPLHLLHPDGDFDGDGVSNFAEYIAGTYATDPNDFLRLQIVDHHPGHVILKFYGIIGKTYSVESSPDAIHWSSEPFSAAVPENPGNGITNPQGFLTAPTTGPVVISSANRGESKLFYRLAVR
jgi:hypothetical protein